MEWLLGNSFPATFFGVFGGFFLSYGATITPAYGAYLSYDPSSAMEAVKTPAFIVGLGKICHSPRQVGVKEKSLHLPFLRILGSYDGNFHFLLYNLRVENEYMLLLSFFFPPIRFSSECGKCVGHCGDEDTRSAQFTGRTYSPS